MLKRQKSKKNAKKLKKLQRKTNSLNDYDGYNLECQYQTTTVHLCIANQAIMLNHLMKYSLFYLKKI